MPTNLQNIVTSAHREQYEREGYFILENVVPVGHLELLRNEVGKNIDAMDARMEEMNVKNLGINVKGSRYFVCALKEDPDSPVTKFIYSDLMEQIVRATLGDNAYLFFEQYVVKAAEKGGDFSWHQDSGYVGYADHKPYLTCWVTLDDVSEENGTVYILPYERAGTRDYVPHVRSSSNNDLVGYSGDDSGIPIIAPAGSIACFSSTVFHRSGANTTNKMRRVYLPQYSSEPILRGDGSGQLWSNAEPFVINGERVRFE